MRARIAVYHTLIIGDARYTTGMMTTDELKSALEGAMRGEVTSDEGARGEASRDTSLFSRMPELVVYPKDARDLSALVKEVARARSAGAQASLTARAGGTDMSGGPLTTSVAVSLTKHMNRVLEVGDGYAVTEPGVFYRDFEKKTLEKNEIFYFFQISPYKNIQFSGRNKKKNGF